MNNEYGCAPAIWKKMNSEGQYMWQLLYETFYDELRLLNMISGFADLNKTYMETIAHNLACHAVWTADSMELLEER